AVGNGHAVLVEIISELYVETTIPNSPFIKKHEGVTSLKGVASRDIFPQTLTCSRIHVLREMADSSFSAGGLPSQNMKTDKATNLQGELGVNASNGIKTLWRLAYRHWKRIL
ncbi:MAG: hypothetical protein ACLQMF_14300, partial [Rectinemataceae bacterium]